MICQKKAFSHSPAAINDFFFALSVVSVLLCFFFLLFSATFISDFPHAGLQKQIEGGSWSIASSVQCSSRIH